MKPVNSVPLRGECLPRPDCFDDGDCEEGERCDLDTCVPVVCQSDEDMVRLTCVAGRLWPTASVRGGIVLCQRKTASITCALFRMVVGVMMIVALV